MRNQPHSRLFQSLPPAISHLTMEQRDAPNTMYNAFGNDRIGSSILQVILESQDNSHLLSDLANKIGELLAVDICIVVSAQANGSNLNQISYWQQEPAFLTAKDRISQELSHLLLNQNDTDDFRLIDRAKSHLFSPIENLFQATLPSKTWLGVTTQFQHQTNGLILLLKSNSAQWTNSEQELLIKISDSMAIAISQTQLQKQTQTKARYQSLLKNLSREISQSSHPNLLFNNCLSQICTTLQLDKGMILMLKYQNPLQAQSRRKKSVKGTVEIASQWTAAVEKSNSQDKLFFSLDNCALCQQAWKNAPKCWYFSSDTPFPDLAPKDTSSSIQPSGSALSLVPLMGKKNSAKSPAVVLGFLVLQHNSPHYWSEDERDLIDWVGVQISTAIIHHQTLSQVQSIVDERTAQLKWSLDVQAKLSEKMRQHIDQLQKLNQLKDDFMNSMSHELKTPLTSMKMAIKMLRQARISPEMREKYLNILEQEWNREYSLIKDLLTLQQVESGELTYSPQELNLKQTINDLAQSFIAKWQPEKGIDLKTKISDSGLKINTDPESLTHILNELLSNAGKYSDAHTTIELTVDSQTTLKGKNIIIAIANYGAGITPEELPHIFEKFRRGRGVTDRAVPGTGLGLALVQYLVEHLNGTISVTSEPSANDPGVFLTTFVLKLPQFQPAIS
ncbi:MAG: ATP-binding protein [Pleurocapsa sp. MO_226.B13]|nr:ATP-binding protein [Pleurocapsa sp. MO_226.B13]